ncbi:hypothetical protein [Roseomonas sp. HF4]|uniref:hypothetical protein n=1 Tax=Roseomonas sp. HF4 TaxID=2562313 RepID=UPI0010C0B923|nr:hypothetical protein [Roseomonas sp. HF4]
MSQLCLTRRLRLVCLALALLLGAGQASAWPDLEEAVALLPDPVESGGTSRIFEYAHFARLRAEGDIGRGLAQPLGGAGEAITLPDGVTGALGAPPDAIRRGLFAGTPNEPLTILWGEAGFAATAAARLRARGFSESPATGGTFFSWRDEDDIDVARADPRDPFSFSGQPQRLLLTGDTLAGTVSRPGIETLAARLHVPLADRPATAQVMVNVIATLRQRLPGGIEISQAYAHWPDAFARGETDRRRADPDYRGQPLPDGVQPDDARLSPFGFAILASGTQRQVPILLVVLAYDTEADASLAAPVVVEGLRRFGMVGEGAAAGRVLDWVVPGQGFVLAGAVVMFPGRPAGHASELLVRWADAIQTLRFPPLDLFH